MCTTSIVRFRFSLKDNITKPKSNQLNNSIRGETKARFISLANISSSGVGLKHQNNYLTENHINMNKGLSNGHEFCLSNNLDVNVNSNSDHIITTTTTTTATTTSTPSTVTTSITTSDTAMGLLNSNSKDSLTHNLLLTSLKSGKPENGQRIDFTNIAWNDLKQTNTSVSSDAKTNEVSVNSNELETNSSESNCPTISDQPIEQLINEEMGKNEQQVEEQVKEEPKQETNSTGDHEQQTQESSMSSAVVNDSNEDDRTRCSSMVPQPEPLDLKAQQISLEKQSERLMRRIRRLQFKQTHKHIAKQMKAFVEHQQIVTGIPCQRQTESNVPQLQSVANQVEDRMKLLTPEGVKGLSTSALVNLVKRLGSTANPSETNRLNDFYSQQTPIRPQPQTPSFTTTSSSSGIPSQIPQTATQILPNSSEETALVKLLQKSQASSSSASASQVSRVGSEDKEAIVSTIDTLNANLRHFESGFDSDATESSSGGESCDEFEDYNHDPIQQHSTPIQTTGQFIPMRKRSCWKWCVERGAVASRWTWLQAQVADLEFRIRQQNEMYRQLRATKGHISYGVGDHNLTVPTPSIISKVNSLSIAMSLATNSGVNSNLPQNQPQQLPQQQQQQQQPPQASQQPQQQQPPQAPQQSSSDSDSHYCMRTLPLNSMRKRKLVRSMNALSGATRKAAKYSTVQCACNGLPDIVSPCVLCNGRYSYVHVIDTDCMPHFERVALLDSSCHPVLSLPNDVSLGLHFSELLKRETIQRPIPQRQQNKKRKGPPSPTFGKQFVFDPKNKSPKRSQSVISSTKLRKKYDGAVKRKYVRRSGSSGDGVFRKRGRPRERISSGSSRTESPIPSPVPSESSSCGNSLSAPLHRRRRSEQHAFDINNIVIPYSIAATTRVEKLQYKEIITPKWRINEPFTDSSRFSQPDIKTEINSDLKSDASQLVCTEDANEDISDTSFTLRHAKCEEEERRRILSFMKGSTKQSGTHLRGRGARVRFDSTRSDTMTPSTTPCGGDNVQNVDTTSQDSCCGSSAASVVQNCKNDSVSNTIPETPPPVGERRRNASLSSRREDSIDENFETVTPFDLRTFPLNDIDYDLMIKESEHLYSCEEESTELNNDPEKSNEGTITANNSRAPSPINSDAAESIADHIEDIDNEDEDPEWEPEKK